MSGASTYAALVFWIFAVATVASAAAILLVKDIVRQAFCLLLSLSGVAGLYLTLGADFLGFTQVIVYIGGILILFLFGVMLTHRGDVPLKEEEGWNLVGPAGFTGGITAGLLLYTVLATPWRIAPRAVDQTVATIGRKVMGPFILPFEVVSLLLLVSLVGAAYIARRKGREAE